MQNFEIGYKLKDHEERLTETCERVTKLEDIVKGDGKGAGLAPMTLAHEEELHGNEGVLKRLTNLEKNAIRTAAYTSGAVAAAMVVYRVISPALDKISKMIIP